MKEIEKELSQAQKNKLMAGAYFNFLLNRDLETEIIINEPVDITVQVYNLDSLKSKAVEYREELSQLNKYIDIN